MPKEPTSVCPFCFPFYPLSQRILLPSRLKHCFWDYPRPALPPSWTAYRNRVCPWAILSAADARCGLSSSPCGHRSLCRKAGASHRRQSIAAIKVQADCPPGASGKTRQSKRHPLSGGCPVLFLGSFFLPADLFQVQAVFQNVAHSIEQSDAEQQ